MSSSFKHSSRMPVICQHLYSTPIFPVYPMSSWSPPIFQIHFPLSVDPCSSLIVRPTHMRSSVERMSCLSGHDHGIIDPRLPLCTVMPPRTVLHLP